MKTWAMIAVAFALTASSGLSNDAGAETLSTAAKIRGSWITERDGARYIYIFAVEGNRLSGVVCAKCYDLDNITFVSDGRVEGDSLSFTLVHEARGRPTYTEKFRGKPSGDQIALSVSRSAGGKSAELSLKRPPSRVAEIFAEDAASRPRVAPESFLGPGPSEPLTPENALGVWRSPVGSTAYIFKQAGDHIMGIACDSRCEDGSYSAFIESATITRNTFLASIVHADKSGESYANLLTLYLADGRMTGTYVDTRHPEKRVIHVMVRQNDPAAPKDAAWRGAF